MTGKKQIFIGIDPGTKTGVAVWNAAEKKMESVRTMNILEAIDYVKSLAEMDSENLTVRIEDPNQRKWFGKSGREKLQGAGSIKRDFAIWREFLESEQINFEAIHPKKIATKMRRPEFDRLTKWKAMTDQHGRDAAMMVFGIAERKILK